MTVRQLLAEANSRGIRLEARDGRLRFEAPRGAMTPDLRDSIHHHRDELLTLLDAPTEPTEFVLLQGGLAVPASALQLAIDLEARGFKQSVIGDGAYHVEPAADLTDVDRAGIVRWRRHLAALVSYEPPEVA